MLRHLTCCLSPSFTAISTNLLLCLSCSYLDVVIGILSLHSAALESRVSSSIEWWTLAELPSDWPYIIIRHEEDFNTSVESLATKFQWTGGNVSSFFGLVLICGINEYKEQELSGVYWITVLPVFPKSLPLSVSPDYFMGVTPQCIRSNICCELPLVISNQPRIVL